MLDKERKSVFHWRTCRDAFVLLPAATCITCSTALSRAALFEKDGDYAAFLRVVEEARDRQPMRVLAYCVICA